MNKSGIVLMLIASILAVAFIIVRVTAGTKSREGAVVSMLLKALASVGFIAVGVGGIFSGVDNIKSSIFVLFGLVMGLIGDIVLDEKLIHQGEKSEGIYLTGGMVSFGIGHVFFLVAICLFLGPKVITGGIIGISIAVGAIIDAVMLLAGRFILKFDFGKYLIHSILYGFALAFMSALSVACCIVMENKIMVQFMIGMVLFLLSDIVLTQQYFGGRSRDKVLTAVNHALYYGAQIAIAGFIFFM